MPRLALIFDACFHMYCLPLINVDTHPSCARHLHHLVAADLETLGDLEAVQVKQQQL